MVVYGFEIVIPKGLISVRDQRNMATAVHKELGHHWHDTMLPRHFQPGAAERYDYQPRKPKYVQRKARTGRGPQDLVYSGKMRRQLTQFAMIRAYPSRFSVRMIGPYYISMRPNLRGARASMPYMAGEIVRLTDDEAKELADMAADELTKRMKQFPGVERIVVN